MYSAVETASSRKASERERIWFYPPTLISYAVLAVMIVLLALLLARPADLEVTRVVGGNDTVDAACNNALIANATLCDQTTDCLRGFASPVGDACVYYPRPAGTANCSSACYTRPGGPGNTTRCDGDGRCIGDAADCFGACDVNLDCNARFNFNSALLNTFDPVTFWTGASWYNPFGCLFNRCVGLVLDIFSATTARPLFAGNITYEWTPLGALNECRDYLMPEHRETYKECLSTERYLLDATIIRSYNLFSGGTYANSTFPFQMSVCIFSFSCAPFAGAQIAAAETAAAASPSSVVIQTQEQYGFHAVAGTTDTPRGPMLGIHSPVVRSAAWARLRDAFADVPPGYFDPLLNQPNLVASPSGTK